MLPVVRKTWPANDGFVRNMGRTTVQKPGLKDTATLKSSVRLVKRAEKKRNRMLDVIEGALLLTPMICARISQRDPFP